jgi:methionyl-tRNA formyltransferase
MKIACLTQKPIQTLNLIYMLAQNDIHFDLILFFKKRKNQKFNKNDEGKHSYAALKYQCNKMSIPLYNVSNNNPARIKSFLLQKKIDYGISLVADTIINYKIIEKFKKGIFATHAGILPNFKGVDANKWAILNNYKKVGISLYKLDGGVDAGPIIKVVRQNYKGKFKKLEEINRRLYYTYKLKLFVDLFKNIKNKKTIIYKKNSTSFKQYYKMKNKLVKIVERKLSE